jgi:hypothetical protein
MLAMDQEAKKSNELTTPRSERQAFKKARTAISQSVIDLQSEDEKETAEFHEAAQDMDIASKSVPEDIITRIKKIKLSRERRKSLRACLADESDSDREDEFFPTKDDRRFWKATRMAANLRAITQNDLVKSQMTRQEALNFYFALFPHKREIRSNSPIMGDETPIEDVEQRQENTQSPKNLPHPDNMAKKDSESNNNSKSKKTSKRHIGCRRCNLCNKEFSSNSSYKDHLLIHKREKPFACETCHQQCRQKSNVVTHIFRKHIYKLNDNLMRCLICDETYRDKLLMKQHLRQKHVLNNSFQKQPEPKKITGKRKRDDSEEE